MSVYPQPLAIAPASYHSSHGRRSARHSDTRSSRHPSVGAPHQLYSFAYSGSHHSGVAGVPSSGLLNGSGTHRGSVASHQGLEVSSMIPPVYPSDSISQRGSSAGGPHIYGPVAQNALTRARGNPSPNAVYSYGPAVPAYDYLYNPRTTQLALPSPQNYHSPASAPRSSVTVHVFPPPPSPPSSTCHVCGTGMGLGQYPTAQRFFVVPVMMIHCPCTHASTLNTTSISQVLYH